MKQLGLVMLKISEYIKGLVLTPLKKIDQPKGDIYHALKKKDDGFSGFGEVYFSSVHYRKIKGWKLHKKMILNLVVPVGEIEFVVFDAREGSATFNQFNTIRLSQKNYKRLTVPNGVWVAFRGRDEGLNLLLNIASIEHDPNESEVLDVSEITYEWSKL